MTTKPRPDIERSASTDLETIMDDLERYLIDLRELDIGKDRIRGMFEKLAAHVSEPLITDYYWYDISDISRLISYAIRQDKDICEVFDQ